MREGSECSECYYDEDDGSLYCRANGIWECLDDEKEEPAWCPKRNRQIDLKATTTVLTGNVNDAINQMEEL